MVRACLGEILRRVVRGEDQYLLEGSLLPSLFLLLLHSPNVPDQSEGVHPAKTLAIHAKIKRLHTPKCAYTKMCIHENARKEGTQALHMFIRHL